MEPNLLPVFIANRITQIQNLTNVESWRHVPTESNPADLLSRGVCPSDLVECTLWWKVPAFLQEEASEWPHRSQREEIHLESSKSFHSTNATLSGVFLRDLFNKCSSLDKLLRVFAYCRRFILAKKQRCLYKTTSIYAKERNDSLYLPVKLSQLEGFPEYSALKKRHAIKKGRLSALSAFCDERGIIRVGGRLGNSNFDTNKKFPALLDSRHQLTRLIFEWEHKRSLHCGPQLLLYLVRERFWSLRGRNLAKKVVNNCIICFKANPRPAEVLMGHLPSSRVTPAPPFANTGVDYAGPLILKDRKGRGCRKYKAYICLFICFVTKAIHLELVSDLTSGAFLASLRRFVSRRGKPCHIYSDNGTTFVGAHNELNKLGKFLKSEFEALEMAIQDWDISWHFIPSYSPHQGGIWEAGIKSTKSHIKRVASNSILTFEEMYTLLTQIESLLKSRPLTPMSSDPNDLTPLSPAHFLIGRNYTSVVDPSLLHLPENRLSSWQKIQQMQQQLWSRWSKEYISELQQRTKWKVPYPPLQKGSLVVIKEDNLPPANWKLDRITDIHPGRDNIPRVATIKTSTTEIRRSFAKLCPLPIERTDIES